MWSYEKRLQFPVNIKEPNAKLAQVIISQYGGPDGEMGASMRYLSQRYSMPFKEVAGLLTDIGTEIKCVFTYDWRTVDVSTGKKSNQRDFLMQIRVIFAAVAAVAILAGCAAGNDRLRNLNSQQIAEQIVDTQTNRQDVVALLGEPNTTQQEADGTKVLEYTWVRSRPSAKNFIPLNPIDEFPTTKKSLRVWIDDNDRVVKHEYSGVFYVYRKPLIGSNSTHSMRPLTQEELDGLADPTEEAAADKE